MADHIPPPSAQFQNCLGTKGCKIQRVPTSINRRFHNSKELEKSNLTMPKIFPTKTGFEWERKGKNSSQNQEWIKCRVVGFCVERKQEKLWNFGDPFWPRAGCGGSQEKGKKIWDPSLRNQIINPRGNPFNPKSFIEFGSRCLCVLFPMFMAENLEPQLEGKTGCGEGERG